MPMPSRMAAILGCDQSVPRTCSSKLFRYSGIGTEEYASYGLVPPVEREARRQARGNQCVPTHHYIYPCTAWPLQTPIIQLAEIGPGQATIAPAKTPGS